MDYRVYRADIRFWMIVILLSCAVGGSAGYLFFDAWWGCLLIPICIPVVQKRLRQGCLQKRTRQLKTESKKAASWSSACSPTRSLKMRLYRHTGRARGSSR